MESSGLQWSPLDCDWTLKSGLQSGGSPVDQTGLDSSGLGIVPANLAWQIGHWNPLESSGVHMDYVGEGKDLLSILRYILTSHLIHELTR